MEAGRQPCQGAQPARSSAGAHSGQPSARWPDVLEKETRSGGVQGGGISGASSEHRDESHAAFLGSVVAVSRPVEHLVCRHHVAAAS